MSRERKNPNPEPKITGEDERKRRKEEDEQSGQVIENGKIILDTSRGRKGR